MGLISPTKIRNFVYMDKVPRSQVAQKLWALILSSGWAEKNSNSSSTRREQIKHKLKDFFEIAQQDGASTYGEDPENIDQQFSRQYTIGFDTGIWKNGNLELSDNAKEVFEGYISIREYLTRFCCNLFEYVNDYGYIHPLYTICQYAEDQELEILSIDNIIEALPNTGGTNNEQQFREACNQLMNYLAATNLFEKTEVNGKRMSLKFKIPFTPVEVMQYCNLSYKESDQEATQRKFKDAEKYAEYISSKLPIRYYKTLLDGSRQTENENKTEYNVTGAINKIYYGAPGTGKSYQASQNYSNFERITFHPEYTYFDFVGGLKPLSTTRDDGTREIYYDFKPGPFTKTLIKALENPDHQVGLIIEEINRANTAAVFGDIFQLLDRDHLGTSEYAIENDEIIEYVNKTTDKEFEEIVIPPNFNLIATMNSSDQGVYVMDSAFKRRWEYEYTPINFANAVNANTLVAGFGISWKHFAETLNSHLSDMDIEEDKLIGPYFLRSTDIENKSKIASKLFIYLWDDVMRYRREQIFKQSKSFSKLIQDYNLGKQVFEDSLNTKLEQFMRMTSEEVLENETDNHIDRDEV